MTKQQRLAIWRNAKQFRDFMVMEKEPTPVPLSILRDWTLAAAEAWLAFALDKPDQARQEGC